MRIIKNTKRLKLQLILIDAIISIPLKAQKYKNNNV